MGNVTDFEQAKVKAEEKERLRIANQMAKKEVRAQHADLMMQQNLKIKQADKQAKRKLLASGGYDDLLSEKQVTNKLCMEVSDLIGGGLLGFKCHVFQPRKGARRPMIEDENRQVAFVEPEEIKSSIFQYVKKKSEVDSNYMWSMREVDSCYDMWMSRPDTLADVKTFDWLDGVGLTFKRLPFNYVERETYKHPTWDKILGNIESNKNAYMAFIGSIFEPESYKQQYLWMQGSGGDGKGTLLGFLTDLMGNEACARVKANIEQDFWSENLGEARVAYFSDCRRYGLPTSEELLELTGGANLLINQKGKSKFYVKNNIKFIFASNGLPIIENTNRDIRRVIIVKFKSKTEDQDKLNNKTKEDQDKPKEGQDKLNEKTKREYLKEIKLSTVDLSARKLFEEGIKNEGAEFISHCVKIYRKVCPNHDYIPFDDDGVVLSAAVAGESDKRAFIDAYFETYLDDKNVKYNGDNKIEWNVPSHIMTQYIKKFYTPHSNVKSDFLRWLEENFGIYLDKIRRTGQQKTEWCYLGIKVKNTTNYF